MNERDRKYHYFWERYKFVLMNEGKVFQTILTTPEYHLKCILYQITKNKNKSRVYVTNHLRNLTYSHDRFTTQFRWHKAISSFKQNYENSSSADKELLISKKSTINSIKKAIEQVEKSGFEKAIERLKLIINCHHELRVHKEEINYIVLYIISKLRFDDFSNRELNSLRTNICSVLSTNLFPLPDSISKITDRDLFEQERSKYISYIGSSLTNRLEGLQNIFYKNKNDVLYVVRITNLKSETFFKLNIDNIQFISTKDSIFTEALKIAHTEEKDAIIRDFLEEYPNCVLAIIPSKDLDFSVLRENLIPRLEKALYSLDHAIHIHPIISVSRALKLYSNGQIASYGSSEESDEIIDDSIEWLQENPYKWLEVTRGDLKRRLLFAEPYYVNARKSGKPYDYWHYLEVLIPHDKNYEKQIKKFLINYVSVNRKKIFERIILNLLYNAIDPWLIDNAYFGISEEEHKKYATKIRTSTKLAKDLFKYKATNRISMVFNIYKELFLIGSADDHIKNYVQTLLEESYELRNKFIHSGINDREQQTRLGKSVGNLVSLVRIALVNEACNNPGLKLETVISKYL